jgi:dCMP deaminase
MFFLQGNVLSHLHKHILIILNRYNGTPRGLPNCNEGGCCHCNGTTLSVGIPYECVCLHAEENALLEAGRERVGQNAVLYCNTLVSFIPHRSL